MVLGHSPLLGFVRLCSESLPGFFGVPGPSSSLDDFRPFHAEVSRLGDLRYDEFWAAPFPSFQPSLLPVWLAPIFLICQGRI